jgi:uncharacterized membrane protein YtjA (UPF0391 family)
VLGGAGVRGPTAGDAFIYFVIGFWMLVCVVMVVGFLQQSKEMYEQQISQVEKEV